MKVYTNNQKYKIGKVVYKLETSVKIVCFRKTQSKIVIESSVANYNRDNGRCVWPITIEMMEEMCTWMMIRRQTPAPISAGSPYIPVMT